MGRACPSRVPLFCSTKGECAHPPDRTCPPSFAAPPPLLRTVTRRREGCEHDPARRPACKTPAHPAFRMPPCACRPTCGTVHAWHTKGGAGRGLAHGTTRDRAHMQCGRGTASLRPRFACRPRVLRRPVARAWGQMGEGGIPAVPICMAPPHAKGGRGSAPPVCPVAPHLFACLFWTMPEWGCGEAAPHLRGQGQKRWGRGLPCAGVPVPPVRNRRGPRLCINGGGIKGEWGVLHSLSCCSIRLSGGEEGWGVRTFWAPPYIPCLRRGGVARTPRTELGGNAPVHVAHRGACKHSLHATSPYLHPCTTLYTWEDVDEGVGGRRKGQEEGVPHNWPNSPPPTHVTCSHVQHHVTQS